ncbi:hypothetical protein [Pseudoalteromonas ruthenica]|uniref:hypothetical protein n=1 Tax=Pseudoalteromonas ruthenica TaxID=151081 RepID=UPI00241C4EE3|nr:hypothetical protein [Pseudoalteromonas ruthenica]|tara:strand:- start:26087 stop:26254 length:168 start_codon:yes stop_codon:yes gene_type:complete
MQKGMDEDTRYIHDILRQKRERAQQGEEMAVWKKGEGLIKEDHKDGVRSKVQQKG